MSRQQLWFANELDLRKGNSTINRRVLLWILLVGVIFSVLGMTKLGSASGTANAMVYLPVIMADYQGTLPMEGIRGLVTERGVPAAGVPLTLRLWDGSDETSITTTTTDGNGNYLFTGIDSLEPEEDYYVRFGPNDSDSSRVYYWFGPDIDEYISGTLVDGIDFDIANADLIKPDDGATESLPVTFSWERRGVPGDSYRVILVDLDSFQNWTSADLGDTGSFMTDNLPPDIESGKPYGWYLEIFNGPGNSYGESFDFREVTFMFNNSLHQPSVRSELPRFRERTRETGNKRLTNDS